MSWFCWLWDWVPWCTGILVWFVLVTTALSWLLGAVWDIVDSRKK